MNSSLRMNGSEGDMELLMTLSGHTKSVNMVLFNEDGTILISAGDDATVRVWSTQSGEQKQEIECLFHGPVGSIAWVNLGSGLHEAFVFGCSDGSIHLYVRDDQTDTFRFRSSITAHRGYVEDIQSDARYGRLASVGDGTVQVWKLGSGTEGSMSAVWNIAPRKDYIVRTVRFCDDGASVLAFYVESHEICCYIIEPFGLKWSKTLPTRTGHAALSADQSGLWITNLADGLDQYRFPSIERTRSFPYKILNNYPMQVAVNEMFAVVGGDDGFIRLFDIMNYRNVEKLFHGPGGHIVQTVTTSSCDGVLMVASGSSGVDAGPCYIKVWRQKQKRHRLGDRRLKRARDGNPAIRQLVLTVIATVVAMNVISAQNLTGLFKHLTSSTRTLHADEGAIPPPSSAVLTDPAVLGRTGIRFGDSEAVISFSASLLPSPAASGLSRPGEEIVYISTVSDRRPIPTESDLSITTTPDRSSPAMPDHSIPTMSDRSGLSAEAEYTVLELA